MLLRYVINQSICLIQQIFAHSGKVNQGLDAEALQQASIADTRELEKLRGLERALMARHHIRKRAYSSMLTEPGKDLAYQQTR
jgi:hypothetical protein